MLLYVGTRTALRRQRDPGSTGPIAFGSVCSYHIAGQHLNRCILLCAPTVAACSLPVMALLLSAGSYSFVGLDASGKTYDTLATPVQRRVLFAGEHTCKVGAGIV